MVADTNLHRHTEWQDRAAYHGLTAILQPVVLCIYELCSMIVIDKVHIAYISCAA